jgi:4-amino-4-deoxy-L-arabinose transferase-like glycosyltransferase
MANEETQNEGYIPGVCNIGKEEIQGRKKSAIVSWCLVVVFIILMQIFHVNHIWRLFIFLLVASAMVGTLQVYFKFCVNFGMRGVFNFGKTGKTFSAELDEYIRKDRAKALRMIIGSVIIGIVVAVIYYLLPV